MVETCVTFSRLLVGIDIHVCLICMTLCTFRAMQIYDMLHLVLLIDDGYFVKSTKTFTDEGVQTNEMWPYYT